MIRHQCRRGPAPTNITPPNTVTGLKWWSKSDVGVVPGTVGAITQWNDQSGAGVVTSVAQATGANQFQLATGGINGLPRIVTPDGARIMTSNTSLLPTGQARTVMFVGASATNVGGQIIQFKLGNPYCALAAQNQTAILPNYWYVYTDNVTFNNQLNPPHSLASPTVLVFTWQGGGPVGGIRVNGRQCFIATQRTGGGGGNASVPDSGSDGFGFGNRADRLGLNIGWLGDIYEYAVFDSIKPVPVIRGLEAYASARYSVTMAPASTSNPLVFFDGDSITRGQFASTPALCCPGRVATALPTYDIANIGIDGRGFGECIAQFANQIAPFRDATRPKNVVVLGVGTNSLFLGDNDTTLYNNAITYLANARSAGFTKVAIATLLGRADGPWTPTMEGYRLAYNAKVRANTAGYDAVIDYVADARLATATPTYFADQLHPNDLGYSVMAGIAGPAVAAI